jgi:nucleoid-associated protein YgaU
MYEVTKGDYLWKIAKKQEVYGDAYAWTRIYNSNKNIIKDPNLIFPNQTFSIPRSVDANQYLVERGDNLAKIASKFGGTFSWYKLFQMNKDLIQDQNMIMPYQVLSLPNN